MNWTDNVLHGWCSLRVGADITVLREREVEYDCEIPRKISEVLIRKVPDDQQVGEPSWNKEICPDLDLHLLRRFAFAKTVCMDGRSGCKCFMSFACFIFGVFV